MRYAIDIGSGAQRDIESIYDYIAYTLENQTAALNTTDAIAEAIEGLGEMPHRFKVWLTEPWHSRRIRSLSVGNYNVMYEVDETSMKVTILRVFYCRQNI